jgi:hypothetical protein
MTNYLIIQGHQISLDDIHNVIRDEEANETVIEYLFTEAFFEKTSRFTLDSRDHETLLLKILSTHA